MIHFFPRELQRGESKYRQRGNLVVTTWKLVYRKLVYIMCTNVSPTATTTAKCRTKDGHVENVTCPLSIQLYNNHMGGVDRADQLSGYYHVRMKSHMFYQFVLFEFFRVHSLYLTFSSTFHNRYSFPVSLGLLHSEFYSLKILSVKHWNQHQATNIQAIQA